MKKITGLLLTIVFLLGFAVAAYIGYTSIRHRQVDAPRHQPPQPALEFLEVGPGSGYRGIPVTAMLKSRVGVKVMPEISGKITYLPRHEGDLVQAGEVLARIESDELQTQLRVAGAQSSSAGKQTTAAEEGIRSLESQIPSLTANKRFWLAENDRDRELFKQGALSQAQSESTANKLAEASARLSALNAQISAARAQRQAVASQKDAANQNVELWRVRNRYAEVLAPLTGIISARLQEPGQVVTPNTALYHLEDTSSVRLIMQVPQQYTDALTEGMSISLSPSRTAVPNHSAIPSHQIIPTHWTISRLHPTVNQWRQRTIEAEPVTGGDDPALASQFDRRFSATVVVAEAAGILIPADGHFPGSASERTVASVPLCVVYQVQGNRADRRELQPLLITDSGEAIVSPDHLPSGSRLLRLRFLEYTRLPESLPLPSGDGR